MYYFIVSFFLPILKVAQHQEQHNVTDFYVKVYNPMRYIANIWKLAGQRQTHINNSNWT
jgi:hypothetical protein